MKSMEALIAEEIERSGGKPEELKELNLDGRCRSKHLEGLETLTSLQELSLCYIGLTSLEGLPVLPDLRILHLADNKIHKGLECLTNLEKLEKLNLVHNAIESVDELRPLSKLNIKQLDLFACPVEECENFRETVFEMLPSLEVLDNANKSGDKNSQGESVSSAGSESSSDEDDEYEPDESDKDAVANKKAEDEQNDGGDDPISISSDEGDSEGSNEDVEQREEDEEGDENGSRVDLSLLVGPPIDDSEEDRDYVEDRDDPFSEELEDDADEDSEAFPPDGVASSPRHKATSSEGGRKRKREDQNKEL